jgi:hypothetical protein
MTVDMKLIVRTKYLLIMGWGCCAQPLRIGTDWHPVNIDTVKRVSSIPMPKWVNTSGGIITNAHYNSNNWGECHPTTDSNPKINHDT